MSEPLTTEAIKAELAAPRTRAVDGATFVLDAPEQVPAVWGGGTDVAWAQGETLLVVGPQGVGKTTLAGQLALARCGIAADLDVLCMTVTPDLERPMLYIAADRPHQVARSLRRLVTERDRQQLEDRLVVWPGPLPFDLIAEPKRLSKFAVEHGAGTLVIDSLKDVAIGIAKDEVGAAVNLAHQHTLAAGIEVLALHHQRKEQADNRRPRALADVYGSTWLTAGTGSVLLLWGEPGDLIVELHHLKQPAAELGPLTLIHDHETGRTELHQPTSLLQMVRMALNGGLEVRAAAQELYGTADPNRNQIEKARRRLRQLVTAGQAVEVPGDEPKAPVRYRPVDHRHAEAA